MLFFSSFPQLTSHAQSTRRKLQSELEHQIREKEKQEVEEKGADKEYVEYVMNDQELYHKEERAKKREQLRKQHAIREARAKQIAENNAIRQAQEKAEQEWAVQRCILDGYLVVHDLHATSLSRSIRAFR